MCPALFCCLKQDGQDEQDGQDRAAQECGEKVWKTFMSIERRRNTEKRSDRTFMSIEPQSQHGEKVRRTLMSIERRSNKEKRSVGPSCL